MAEKVPHQSDSSIQGEAEKVILAGVEAHLGISLAPAKIALPGGSTVNIDGVSEDPSVLVEIYARQGVLKGGQPNKLAKDALKLMTVRQLVRPNARLILALGSEEAHKHFIGKSWIGEALRAWSVEIMVVPIPIELRTRLIAVQARQRMVNPPDVEDTGTL